MLNKKGQALIIFIIFIPIFIMICAYVIDMGYKLYHEIRLYNTSVNVIESVYEDNDYLSKSRKLFEDNKISIDNLDLIKDDGYELSNSFKIESIFGRIIGLKEYEISVDINCYKENNKVICKKK